jgi:hypothetical protein
MQLMFSLHAAGSHSVCTFVCKELCNVAEVDFVLFIVGKYGCSWNTILQSVLDGVVMCKRHLLTDPHGDRIVFQFHNGWYIRI